MGVLGWVMVAGLVAAQPGVEPWCVEPVVPRLAAQRAVALGFMASRAWLELKTQQATQYQQLPELRTRNQSLQKRSAALDVAAVMDAEEVAMMALPLGSWSREQVSMGSWAMEGAATLLWALKVRTAEGPPTEPAPMADALKPIMEPGGAEALVKKASLRPGVELEKAYREAELFHWRAALENANRRTQAGKPGAAAPVDALARNVWEGRSLTNQHDGKDLLVGRIPVYLLDSRSLTLLTRTSDARQAALAFTCQKAAVKR